MPTEDIPIVVSQVRVRVNKEGGELLYQLLSREELRVREMRNEFKEAGVSTQGATQLLAVIRRVKDEVERANDEFT